MADPPAARLEYVDTAGRSRVVPVAASPFRIGRSHTNHLSLPDHAEVSREHAEIAWEADHFVLRDRASRAGTFLNDVGVTEATLADGDRFRVGPHIELTFALGAGRPQSDSSTSNAVTDLRQTATLLAGLRALGTARVLDHVLEMVIDSAIAVTGAERGFIMLVGPDGTLEFKLARDRHGATMAGTHFDTSQKIPEEVFTSGATRLVEDLLEGERGAGHEGTIRLGIRHVLCAPLRVVQIVESPAATEDERRIGVLYLDSRERRSLRSDATRDALETLANEAAIAIENARLYREAQEKVRLEQDLQTANEFQRALLPQAAPEMGFFVAAAEMLPCRMIGGDFFEYVPLDDDTLGFTLGDVAGKGAPAGLLGARIQEIFLAQSTQLVEPGATLAAINRILLQRALESRFVTMLYGVLTRDGILRYSNAGHNPPFLLTRQGVRRLATGGLIVGLFDGAGFEEERIQLEPGDTLVIFSDGISEATNRAGEEFGDARIIDCIQATDTAAAPRALVDRLFGAIQTFTFGELPGDDMTVLVLRFIG